MLKVVFHIDQVHNWTETLANIKNLLKENQPVEIFVVVNGVAVQGYLDEKISAAITALADKVQFEVCHNALVHQKIDEQALPAEVVVVSAGVLALIQHQQAGCAYIKP